MNPNMSVSFNPGGRSVQHCPTVLTSSIQADVPGSKLVKPPHGQHRRQFRFGAPHVLIQA